jgi:hypothetical protein
MKRETTYQADVVIAAEPEEVWEVLVDPDHRTQWQDRFSQAIGVNESNPPHHVVFTDGLQLELERVGDGTLVVATRTRSPIGIGGKLGGILTSRRNVEDELRAILKRIEATVRFG